MTTLNAEDPGFDEPHGRPRRQRRRKATATAPASTPTRPSRSRYAEDRRTPRAAHSPICKPPKSAPRPRGRGLRLAIVADPLSQQGSELQADAPACDVCGSITVRSGTCYKCLNCGNSMGCS